MSAQTELSQPKRKRLWQSLIRAKISAQGHALQLAGLDYKDVLSMAMRVKSGDPDNIEAQAARRYWSRIMGAGFTRDRSAANSKVTPAVQMKNAALNYGYTVLRAACARSIVAAGLHPSLSIYHQSRGQALRLADDLMEPFRPWVDLAVYQNRDQFEDMIDLTPDIKATLVSVLSLDLQTHHGASPLQLCLDRLAQSFAAMALGARPKLDLPGPQSRPSNLIGKMELV